MSRKNGSASSGKAGPPLTMASVGATLLALGDVDHDGALPDADPVRGALA